MPQLTRHYCSRCQNAIYNTIVDGKRIPILLYFVVGQPDDTGEFDVNGPGVRLPSFVREIMQPHVPVARAELCMVCVSELFGVPLLTAEEDPLYSAEQTEETAKAVREIVSDKNTPHVTKAATAMDRVFLGLQVGRGATAAPPLPPTKKTPPINSDVAPPGPSS
jgi:hypothetical protein